MCAGGKLGLWTRAACVLHPAPSFTSWCPWTGHLALASSLYGRDNNSKKISCAHRALALYLAHSGCSVKVHFNCAPADT